MNTFSERVHDLLMGVRARLRGGLRRWQILAIAKLLLWFAPRNPSRTASPTPSFETMNTFSTRQLAAAHEEGIHRVGGLAAFADGPDDERLAPAHVARRKHARHAGGVAMGGIGAGLGVATGIGGHAQLGQQLGPGGR